MVMHVGELSHTMATAAVIGLNSGKRLLSSSFYNSDFTEKVLSIHDHGLAQHQTPAPKNMITAKKTPEFGAKFSSVRHTLIKALKEHVDASASITADTWVLGSDFTEEESSDIEYSLEALLLLQKSMLEKQWNLSFQREGISKKIHVTSSGISARQRRTGLRRKSMEKYSYMQNRTKHFGSVVSPELLAKRFNGYVRGVASDEQLTHTEVVILSKKIKAGLSVEEHKSKLKERLGCDPSDEQLATSLRISRVELRKKLMECSLAKEKLTMSNVRLVMSIAHKYDHLGAELSDLVQAGLIGLLRGIEKYDSTKGYKISTYVYWWIRQGVSRALAENSRTLRLPMHIHERLNLIRNAKIQLDNKGITPSTEKIAKCLNISEKKVRNVTEGTSKVFSLDREAFPSLNGLPGETLHSYIGDNRPENNPWHGFEELSLKNEVRNLIRTTLGAREQDILSLYYGLGNECLTWEDISKRIGLSRERVRQVGLVAMEKLKQAARKKKLEGLLARH